VKIHPHLKRLPAFVDNRRHIDVELEPVNHQVPLDSSGLPLAGVLIENLHRGGWEHTHTRVKELWLY
jgi:hypothetical protein